MTTIRNAWIITQRDLQHWRRQPWTPLFGLAFSIMLLLMFGFLLGGAIVLPGDGDYLQFLLPGMFTLSMLFGLDATMTAVGADARKGVTDRFRSMPIGDVSVSLGRAGADMLSSSLELAVLVAGGLLIGWRADGGPGTVALAIVLLLWLRFAMLWLGIYLGLVLREGATTLVQVLVWPIGFLSSVFVAPETMPGWLRAIAEWNPLSATAAATRDLFGNPTGITSGVLAEHALLLAAVWPLAICAVFIPLSAVAFRRLGR